MSITSYTGKPGAGKSYEVVKNVILPAIAEGRRIVTNIDGIDQQKVLEYVEDHLGPCTGEIVVCKESDITSDCFYPVSQDDSFSFVRPGDLVIIDEAQNFYRTGQKLSDHECKFFREHRHFCDEEGRGCDIVLISQRFVDIQPFVRGVVELCFVMRQLKVFSLPNYYTVTVYEGDLRHKISGPTTHKYQKEIFELYKSFAVTGGMQARVDKRQSLFSFRFFFILTLLLVFLFGSFKVLFTIFSPERYQKSDKRAGITSLNTSSGVPPPVSSTLSRNVPVRPVGVNYSKRWRILGTLGVGTSRHIVIGDKDGMLRFEHPQNFKGNGSTMTGKIDGETVTKFTGEFEKKEDQQGGLNL